MLWYLMDSWKAFSASCWSCKCFPCQKLSRCLKKWAGERSGEYGRWGRTSYPNSFNFWSTDSATWDRELWRIGPFLVTSASCRRCSLWRISWISRAYFSDVHWDSESCIGLAADYQMMTMTFVGGKFGFGKCFGASYSNHWAGCCRLSYKIHFVSYVTIQLRTRLLLLCRIRWHFKMTIFLIRGQLMRHPLIECFHLSNLIQMSNSHRMVDTDFFGNFSCRFKRTSFDDPLSWFLPTSNGRPLCSSSSRTHLLCKSFWTTTAV